MAHVAFPLRCSHARLSAARTPSADPRSLLLPGSTHVSPVALVAVVAVVSSAAGVSPPTARGVHRLADADADRLDAATDLAGAERAAKHAKEAVAAALKGVEPDGPAAKAQALAASKKGQPALKWLQVSRRPNALTLHLKRFRTDASGRTVHKLDGHVPFPVVLDMNPFSCGRGKVKHFEQLGAPSHADGSARYRLYGVVEHQGSFKGGHYVAFVKGASGEWHRMSDSTVSRVDEQTALAAQAFLLFYERAV